MRLFGLTILFLTSHFCTFALDPLFHDYFAPDNVSLTASSEPAATNTFFDCTSLSFAAGDGSATVIDLFISPADVTVYPALHPAFPVCESALNVVSYPESALPFLDLFTNNKNSLKTRLSIIRFHRHLSARNFHGKFSMPAWLDFLDSGLVATESGFKIFFAVFSFSNRDIELANTAFLRCLLSQVVSFSSTHSIENIRSRVSPRCLRHSNSCDCLITKFRRTDVVLIPLADAQENSMLPILQDAYPSVIRFVYRATQAEKYIIYGFDQRSQLVFSQSYTSLAFSTQSCSGVRFVILRILLYVAPHTFTT
eukprot:GHVR01014504.1.p1 GENE.GHVR01014504.1~~GHVR01014504.1.p1  ORF type:complete len:310 (-),score=-11.91 GHVR01014504.1:214-1143(-)